MTSRPEEALKRILADYPKLDGVVNHVIEMKGEVESWPDDVFVPFSAWMAVAESYLDTGALESNDVTDPRYIKLYSAASKLAAVSTWRYSKGIYRFERALYDALLSTPLPSTIPMRVFRRLPDWCPYIELPEPIHEIHGYYCYLDFNPVIGAWELYLMPDTDSSLPINIPIELTEGLTIEEAATSFDGVRLAEDELKILEMSKDTKKLLLDYIKPALSLLLYLCQDEPEIDDTREPGLSPSRNYPTKIKGGYRLFEPSKVRTWDVGQNISKVISEGLGRSGKGKSPHLRRGHWHGFWTGPRKGERKFIYHWIPAVVINADEAVSNIEIPDD